MSESFPQALSKLRETAGYPSAMSFFNGSGGRAYFGCTYKHYQNIEAGRSRPDPRLVERLAAALHVARDEMRARLFVSAYLRSTLGSESLVELIAAVLSGKAPKAAEAPLRQALRRHHDERTVPLTAAQSAAIRRSVEHNLLFILLASDKAAHAEEALAKRAGVKLADAKRVLAELGRAGLVVKEKGGWRCPKAGYLFVHPREALYASPQAVALCERWHELARSRGGTLFHEYLLLRAPESSLRSYLPYLAQSVSGADVYSTTEKGPDTALFLVEALVTRVIKD